MISNRSIRKTAVKCVTFDDIVELWGAPEVRQKEAIGLNEAPQEGDTSAPELVLIRVPELGHTGLRLDSATGLKGVDSVNLALIPLLLPAFPAKRHRQARFSCLPDA